MLNHSQDILGALSIFYLLTQQHHRPVINRQCTGLSKVLQIISRQGATWSIRSHNETSRFDNLISLTTDQVVAKPL